MFLSGESKQRAKHIDRAVAATVDVLKLPEVQIVLPPSLLQQRLDMLDTYFVPNFRDGKVEIPKKYRESNRVPMLAIQVGETMLAGGGLGMTPLQRQNALSQARGWKPRNGGKSGVDTLLSEVSATLDETKDHTMKTVLTHQKAFVSALGCTVELDESMFSNIGKDTQRRIIGRPVLGLVIGSAAGPVEPHVPATIMHELQHVVQAELSPIGATDGTARYEDQRLRDELEAYHVGASIERVLYNSDDPRYANNTEILNDPYVEAVRLEHAPESDPFAPRGAIRKVLLEAGFDY